MRWDIFILGFVVGVIMDTVVIGGYIKKIKKSIYQVIKDLDKGEASWETIINIASKPPMTIKKLEQTYEDLLQMLKYKIKKGETIELPKEPIHVFQARNKHIRVVLEGVTNATKEVLKREEQVIEVIYSKDMYIEKGIYGVEIKENSLQLKRLNIGLVEGTTVKQVEKRHIAYLPSGDEYLIYGGVSLKTLMLRLVSINLIEEEIEEVLLLDNIKEDIGYIQNKIYVLNKGTQEEVKIRALKGVELYEL